MGLLVSADTYVRSIRDDGTEYVVVYRHLSGFQRSRIQSMQASETGAELDVGAMKARAIELAVVSWTFPFDLSRENIERLTGDVFDRLFDYVSLDGVEPPPQIDDPDVPLADVPSSSQSGESGESGS